MRTLLGAVQFLTIIPVRARTVEPWRAAVLFPLVGAVLGACGALLFLGLETWMPVLPRALLVVLFWVLVTGALHEDGLADVADAFRAERDRDQILTIMKDSRIGTFGGLALVFSVVARWQGVASLAIGPFLALPAVLGLSRAAIVVLARLSRPATGGMGSLFARHVTTTTATVAALEGVALAALCGWRPGAVLVGAAAALVLAARWYFHRRIGGVTGDCLGAASQVVEAVLLGVLSCQSCSW